ncbi:MAG: hypothetical protein RI883_1065 [Bacteroidota bacterium]|jgi:hypothetical protein
MRIRIFLILFILVSFNGKSQDVLVEDEKCHNYKTLGDNSFAYKDYSTAVSHFFKCESYCSDLNKVFYDKLITSLKNTITNTKELSQRTFYIDTLVNVYNNSESKGFYDQSNDLMRAAFILKSNKPDLKKVDELFVRAMKNKHNVLSETQIILYFSNMYNIYLDEHRELKSAFKRRMIKEYFELASLIENEKMSENAMSNLTTYFNNLIKDCQDILPDVEFYLNTLSEIESQKLVELNNLKWILENKKCTESYFYEEVIDSLIYIEPSLELYLISAKCLSSRKEFSKEFSTLFSAKKLAKDDSIKNEIDFLSAKSLFNAGNFIESYKIAITIKGDYFGATNKIAAQCVAMSKESCGNNETEQKLNLIYAQMLLIKSKEQGIDVQNLLNEYSSNFPSDTDLAASSLKRGQEIMLKCWGVKIVIPIK